MWLAGIGICLLLMLPLIAHAQQTGAENDQNRGRPTTVDELIQRSHERPVLPNHPLHSDLSLQADRATAWRDERTHVMLLENDVRAAIGNYGFRAERVVAFITPRAEVGVEQWDVELYLDRVRELGGYGPIQTEAPRLLVTAVIEGEVKLKTDRLDRTPKPTHALVRAAGARVDRLHTQLRRNIVALEDMPNLVPPEALTRRQRLQQEVRRMLDVPERPEFVADPDEPTAADVDADALTADAPPAEPGLIGDRAGEPVVIAPRDPTPVPLDPTDPADPATVPPRRAMHFNADAIVYQEGEQEGYVMLTGGVRLMYDQAAADEKLVFTADRAVVFTDPGLMQGTRELEPDAVRGIYLEDNVRVSDGEYTMRGPRVFYDPQRDRAIVLEAVMYTWDIQRQAPLYVRARQLLQVSEHEWRAEDARLSTSAFARPHFALGMEKLTLRAEQPDADTADGLADGGDAEAGDEPGTDAGRRRLTYRAEGAGPMIGDTALFRLPTMAGEVRDVPLRSVGIGSNSQDGVTLETDWDLFALLGRESDRDVDANLSIDGFTERGIGAGVELDYDVPRAFGEFEAYGLIDGGEDEPSGRDDVQPANEFRGMLDLQHRHDLDNGWEASVELGYVSDPTFLEAFFPDRAYTDKPVENSLYLKQQREDWAFTFLAKHDPLDFMPQPAQLQTPGYTVDKLPELAAHHIGVPLWDNRLTWFSEIRGGGMELNFPDVDPDQLGFNNAESIALFGIANTVNFDDNLRAMGLNENFLWRFDTRQELNMPLTVGPVDVVPYVVGRFTTYSEDFEGFRGEDEQTRLRGTVGVRARTEFSRTYDNVQSDLLDIHRLRHIVEPSVNIHHAESNINQEDLPVFDYEIEALRDGTTARLGVRQTFQTKRGGPGQWQAVDVFRLDTDLVLASGDVLEDSPIGRFIEHRPEFSVGGDHIWTEAAWQISDTLAAVANFTHGLEADQLAQWNFGATYDHTPRLSSFLQLRDIDPLGSRVLRYGIDYRLSRKYHLAVSQAIELKDDDSQSVSFTLTRRLPRALLMVGVDVDTINDTTSIGIAFTPEGLGGAGDPVDNPFLTPRFAGR